MVNKPKDIEQDDLATLRAEIAATESQQRMTIKERIAAIWEQVRKSLRADIPITITDEMRELNIHNEVLLEAVKEEQRQRLIHLIEGNDEPRSSHYVGYGRSYMFRRK